MNTYLIPINESNKPYIKKIIANGENHAKDKLFNYFFDKYDTIEGDSLEEIREQLSDLGIYVGQIYDVDEFL